MLKTPKTNPMHPTIGQLFMAQDRKVYFCDSEDEDGFWMTNIKDMTDRRHVLPEIIGKAYHLIWELIPGHYMSKFGVVHQDEMALAEGLTWSDFEPEEDDILFGLDEDDIESLEDALREMTVDWEQLQKRKD